MEFDFSALASRVATRADVLGCVILSRDGLVLGGFPPGEDRGVLPAWARFSGLGEVTRGFVQFSSEVWAFVHRGAYSAFALASATTRPGILLDLLDQALEELEAHIATNPLLGPPEHVDLVSQGIQAAPPPEPVLPDPVPPEPEAWIAPSEQTTVPVGAPALAEEAGSPPAEVETMDEAEEVDRVALAREFGDLLQGNPWGDET